MYIERMNTFEPCLNLELRKANRVLSQIYDSFLSPTGLKTSQFSILRAIYFLKQTTNRDLQGVLVLDQTSLSRGLKPLVRDGYIDVNPGSDRRQKQLQLSTSGKQLFREAEPLWTEAQHYVATRLGSAELSALLDVSHAVVKLKE